MKYFIILPILLIVYLFYLLSNPEISSDKAKKMIREGKIDYIRCKNLKSGMRDIIQMQYIYQEDFQRI